MSSISAGTTSGTALVSTGDTTGSLVLQTNTSTTALTLNTSGAIGVGTSPSYGTVGQALTSAGSGAPPIWSAPSSGAMVFLSSQTVSSAVASVNFNGLTGYDKYRVIIQNATASTAGSMYLKIGTGSTPTYINPISYMYLATNQAGSFSNGGSATDDWCNLTQQAWNSGLMADITIVNFLSASKIFGWALSHYAWTGTSQLSEQFSSFNAVTGSVGTAIRLIPSSGTINSGSFYLYGITSS